MTSSRIPVLAAILTLGALATACAAYAGLPTPPEPCDSSPSTSIELRSDPPCDFPGTSADIENHTADPLDLARFAWNTFIAISWPAEDPFSSPYPRGVPSRSGKFGDVTPAVVWDTWREKRELYQIREVPKGHTTPPPCVNQPTGKKGDSGTAFVWTAPPADWHGKPSSTGPNPQLGLCPGADDPSGNAHAMQTSKVENYLDESDEINLAVLWAGDAKNPSEETLARYQVKMNYDYYEKVKNENWWCTDILNDAITNSSNKFTVILPSGDNSSATTGTILAKTAWRKLTSEEAMSNDYYMQPALFYKDDVAEDQPCYEEGSFGLIAIHVIRKTKKFPYFFFSTFEHKGNYPGAYTYANTNGTPPDPPKAPFSSTLPNPFGITYAHPSNPLPNAASPSSPAYPANRLIRPSVAATTVNKEAHAKIQGTVWDNYQLVGFQYWPVDKPNDSPGKYYTQGSPPPGPGLSPPYYADQDYYLANAVVETNQRFQFFTGGFSDPKLTNITFYKNNDPTMPASGTTANMGGCMGCHGRTQGFGTDFSFMLGNQTSAPSNFSAQTIECGIIGRTYDPKTQACGPLSRSYAISGTDSPP